jgi:hydroxyethylthiazole kinase-like uncharacterized protein yjeF
VSDYPESSQPLYTATQVRELDRLAVEAEGYGSNELMERAGKAIFDLLLNSWPQARTIAVVCGAGNNAGDGYVVARLLHEAGRKVHLVALTAPTHLRGDALIAAEKFTNTGQTVIAFSETSLHSADVIVDAILGTGLTRELSDAYLAAINAINSSGKPVLSVDIPSGLHADTGKIMGAATQAVQTITFIGRKRGLYTADGVQYRGTLHFADLDVPAAIYTRVQTSVDLVNVESFNYLLTRRNRVAHKGHFGHVLVVGGDYGFAGAVQMSSIAAARAGAGLITVATRPEHALMLPLVRPELMAAGVTESGDLKPLLVRASVVALGPGLGQTDWSNKLFAKVLDTDLPLVVDADGLNLLARDPLRRDNWILTPHPAEAARLLVCTTAEIEADRFASSIALQKQYGGVIVLKGSGTIITGHAGRQSVCADGNPGMASGGMGDVLTGLIAGLLAQGLTYEQAAGLGVCLHARAADLLATERGERGMLASDLLPLIQRLLNP